MLRTNSKKAKENIRQYVMRIFDGTNYGIEQPPTFEETAAVIMDTFKGEHFNDSLAAYYRYNMWESFKDWAAGLPSIIDTCYYYNRSAVDDLGSILEETDAEKAKYSEPEAEEMLTWLIFRELQKVC